MQVEKYHVTDLRGPWRECLTKLLVASMCLITLTEFVLSSLRLVQRDATGTLFSTLHAPPSELS